MTNTQTAVQAPTWHHPHFISAQHHTYSTEYQFKPFTGDEPEPKIPDGVDTAFLDARDGHRYDSDTGRALYNAHQAARDEVQAANTLWQVARHNRRVINLLKEIAPLVAAFQQAKKEAVDAYESLHGTPDGFWQAKLLTITQLRETALDAARRLDNMSGDLASKTDGLPERVLEALPYTAELEKAAGVDFGDWDAQESYGYGDGPDVYQLKKLFNEQDERIERVTRLFGSEQDR